MWKNLLWVDCVGAGLAGIAVLLLSGPLTGFYGLPTKLLIFIALVNLTYGGFSFCLASRRLPRTKRFIALLAGANLFWMPVCFVMAACFRESVTVFGLGQLVGEGLYVGGLALLEWKFRDLLIEPDALPS